MLQRHGGGLRIANRAFDHRQIHARCRFSRIILAYALQQSDRAFRVAGTSLQNCQVSRCSRVRRLLAERRFIFMHSHLTVSRKLRENAKCCV